jgi:high-affinity iron transporter
MSSVLVQAALILLREGLEAMLVIAALAGYLRKVDSAHRVKALYLGALAAIAASIVTAWAFAVFNSGNHNDLLEAFVIIAAAAIMLYVSGWLMIKQDPQAWKAFVSSKADEALAQDTAWAVGMLAFLSVFREGAETVLFITALAGAEGGWSAGLFMGLLIGAVALAALFYVINGIARRIPLRPLFIFTSVFLFVMGVKFIGDAIQEFQEQTILPFTPVAHASLFEALGLNPTVEALGIQFLVVLITFAAFSLVRRGIAMANKQPHLNAA